MIKSNEIFRQNIRIFNLYDFKKTNKFSQNIILIALFIIPIIAYFLFDHSSQSLIAHDEGLYARRAKIIVDSDNWFNPFPEAHHKLVGSYWLIALAIKFLGTTELAVRIPSLIFSILSIFLVYRISEVIFNKRVAVISTIYLLSTPMWIMYSRYASPDMPFVFSSLLINYSIIEISSESNNRSRDHYFAFILGISISLGFLFRTFMILMPLISLLPLLVKKRYYFLNWNINFLLIGFSIGFIPILYSLYLSYQTFGLDSITQLFLFFHKKTLGTTLWTNKMYFILFISLLTYPISFISLISYFKRTKIPNRVHSYIVFIYPLCCIIMLSLISTSHYQYSLLLLPSLAIIAGLTMDKIIFDTGFSKRISKLISSFNFIVFTLLLGFLLYYPFVSSNLNINYSYYYISFLFIFCLSNLFSSIGFYYLNDIHLNLRFFVVSILPFSQFILINSLSNLGLIGNPNTEIKEFVSKDTLQIIYQTKTIYLFNLESKTSTLLSFYLKKTKIVDSLVKTNKDSYVITKIDGLNGMEYDILASIHGTKYKLIKLY